MRKVEVCTYNPNWPNQFVEEAKNLKKIFGPLLVDIHHIGSTSVQGLAAKPIIDIMPIVKDIEQVDALNSKMEAIGYEARGEFGIPGRRYFPKGGDNRTYHVHIFEVGSEHIIRHLAFRDYLRQHPDVLRQYGELKIQLAKQYPNNMDAYINGKNPFIQTIEIKALAWYQTVHQITKS